jgi:hypothetical protein
MNRWLLLLSTLLACGLAVFWLVRSEHSVEQTARVELSARQQSERSGTPGATADSRPDVSGAKRLPLTDAGQAAVSDAVAVAGSRNGPDGRAATTPPQWRARAVPPPDTSECASDLNCPETQACLTDPLHNKNHCLPANCRKDEDCPHGQGCRVVNAADTRGPVRRCVIAGNRLEGQSCVAWPNGPNSACDEGLICALGRCGRPCDTHGPSTCPPTFACASTSIGEDVCLPDCRRDGCPDGKSCVPFGKSMALCLETVTADCREPGHECASGEHCGFSYSPDSVVFHCTRECSTFDTSACQRAEVCGAIAGQSRCLQRCDPKQPTSCPANFRCSFADETHSSYACVPHAPFRSPTY